MIQAPDGAICVDRYAMGEDGAVLPGQPDRARRSGRNRLFVEAVLCIARTVRRGAICRACSASGTRCFTRYRDWVKANVFQACSDEPDLEYLIVKAHRHGQGAKAGLKIRPSAAPR